MGAKRLVIASGNRNKIEEIRDLTKGLGLEVVGIHDLGDFPPVIEDGATFRDNARKKALETARLVQELVLADDSGLEVDALGALPACIPLAMPALTGMTRRIIDCYCINWREFLWSRGEPSFAA